MTIDDAAILEALKAAGAKADEITADWNTEGDPGLQPGSHGTLSKPERAKYHEYVESKHAAAGQALLDACKVDEPIVDEGYESYEAWRQRTRWIHGDSKGAMLLIRLWRATRMPL